MVSVVTTIRRGINSSVAVKVPCKAATTANITLSGLQTLDGISLVSGDRALVKDQTDGSENGIYAVDTSSWQREPDWDGTYDVRKGTYVYVANGTTNNNFWQVSTADPITIGTTIVTLISTDPDSLLRTNLADVSAGQGASLIGVQDSAGNFTATTIEAVLAEISTIISSIGRWAKVYNSTSQTIANATSTAISFDSEFFDTDSIHDVSTNNSRLTVPAGITKVNVRSYMYFDSNTTGFREIGIFKNGATAGNYLVADRRSASNSGADLFSVETGIISVVAGDYFETKVYQNSGGNLAIRFDLPGKSYLEMEIK